MARRLAFWLLLAACLVLAASVSPRHDWSWDLTRERRHSLDDAARRALDALPTPLEATAFVPDLAVQRADIEQLLRPYLRHAPSARLQFVDPVAEPALARAMGVTRHGELHLASGDRREVLPAPDRRRIDGALNRLALSGERWVVCLGGHGERALDGSPAGIGRLVAQIERLGYGVVEIDPRQVDRLPGNASLLLVAGPARDYPAAVEAQIADFVAGGGALLWLVDDLFPPWLVDEVGVGPLPGIVVDAAAARYGLDRPDNGIVDSFPRALFARPPDGHAVLPRARGLDLVANGRWELVAELRSSPTSWNETGSLRGRLARDADRGERAGPITVLMALRQAGVERPGRLVVVGGSEWVSNDQLGQGANLAVAIGLVRWLTTDGNLGAPSPAADLELRWSPQTTGQLAIVAMVALPLAYVAVGWWARWRRRRA